MDAALAEFAAEGWRSFSVEGIARRARAGKASIYLRWSSKQDVLVDAFRAHELRFDLPEAGRVRAALYDLTLQMIRRSVSPAGAAHLRLRTEQDLPAELRAIADSGTREAIESSRQLVKLGIETGELPIDVTPSLFMDCLSGAVTNRAIASALYRGEKPLKSDEEFAQELVAFLLRS